MGDEIRNKRLRLLVSRLNKERKKQAKQIDILCNDFVAAQKDFIKSLDTIGFAADFYEAIAGLTEPNELLCTAGNLIQEQIPDTSVAFFLLANNNFELHIFESDQSIDLGDRRIENFFTAKLVGDIAQSNRICTIEDMLAMGLEGPPACLEKISTAAIPLSTPASSMGFVLIYRSSRNPLTADELKAIAQIAPGLGRSIASCRASVSST